MINLIDDFVDLIISSLTCDFIIVPVVSLLIAVVPLLIESIVKGR